MKRKRKLDTEAIFKYLVKGSILNTGHRRRTCINLDNNFSHVAMIKARRKLHTEGAICALRCNINKQMHKEYILKNHIYAIAPPVQKYLLTMALKGRRNTDIYQEHVIKLSEDLLY